MFKNATPRKISLIVACLVSLVMTLITGCFKIIGAFVSNWNVVFLLFLSCLAVSYWITLLFLQRYIYRKIKLIYKTIHSSKVSSKDLQFQVSPDSQVIDQVEKEVQVWADEQQKEIAHLKEMQEFRRNFLSNVSHELKTPLFNIQGFIHTLLEGGLYDENINKKYLERASINVDRLQTIIEDLDAIAKLESGNLVLDIQSFDVRKLTQEVFEDLEFRARKKRIRLSFKEGADTTFKVNADSERIRQVLINLIDNSIKYGKPGGETKVGFYDMDKYILVEVADNGIGMDEKHIAHVFDRFYRVDKGRSREQGGTGLGLSIAKHIVEAHQQTIHLRSTEGLGSTFGFTLAKSA